MRECRERPAALVRGVWAQGGGGLSGCDSCPAAVGSPCGALGARFPGLRPAEDRVRKETAEGRCVGPGRLGGAVSAGCEVAGAGEHAVPAPPLPCAP